MPVPMPHTRPASLLPAVQAAIAGMHAGLQPRARAALQLAMWAHQGQMRKNGEDYVEHVYAVALRLWQRYADIDTFIAALLHDAFEDNPEVKIEDIYRDYGPAVGMAVDAVSKNTRHLHGQEGSYADKIEKLLAAGMQDVRALLVKLADREDNLASIERLPPYKQVRLSFETQAVYFPLRRVLRWDDTTATLAEQQAALHAYMADSGATTAAQLKALLLQENYADMGNQLYNLVYRQPDRVIWHIHSMEELRMLSQDKRLREHIVIIEGTFAPEGMDISFAFHGTQTPQNKHTVPVINVDWQRGF